MPAFSPALISIMRTVLEEAMTRVPAEQATTATKAYLAEFILKAAAGGLTNYEGLIAAAVSQLPTILSMFTWKRARGRTWFPGTWHREEFLLTSVGRAIHLESNL